MLKPGLGKGLGRLMNGDQVAGTAPPGADMGRGLSNLIAAQESREAAPPKALLPTWFFFAADLLLLAFAVAVAFDAPKPLDPATLLFCGASVILGALLGVAGVLREAHWN